ncbi:PP2C family protein-serine/threonine phosphatase [Thermospira aquatica]|uniref:SpoIIE family protein phosphatase n=1 Tax=Thermospira aquatica TaxID=2828656 RepID=A0AAX3BCS4_9SPIR|nr:SpoIIE family protein phosphatase [Thermospira aquatica]URA10032.1 SpoIIE family protein phosphatase [Thermospira aquatica]
MSVWYVIGGSFGLFLMVQYIAFLLFLLRKGGSKEIKPDLLYIILAGGLISLLGFLGWMGQRVPFSVELAEMSLVLIIVSCFVLLLRYIFVWVKDLGFVETDGYREYTRWYVFWYFLLTGGIIVSLLFLPFRWWDRFGDWIVLGIGGYLFLTGVLEGVEFVSLMKREKGKISAINALRYRTLLFGGEGAILIWIGAFLGKIWWVEWSGFLMSLGCVFMSLAMSFYLIFEYIEVFVREAESRRRLAEVNKKVMDEIRTAQSLQISLLPIDRQRALQKIIDMEISYMPMQSVGGDYYDMFLLSDDVLLFLLGDASGHGVYAAMIWAMLKVEVEELIEEKRFSHLSEAFTVLNRRITRILENTYSYITLFAIMVDRKAQQIHYLSAGHIDQLYYSVKEDAVKHLKNKNPIVGTFKNAKFQEDVIRYHAGDVLLMFSDGVIEGANPMGEQVGLDRLTEFFDVVVREVNSASDVIGGMLMHLEDFYEGAVQDDDRTFMAIRF